jgi:YebC/PmpR family DNA-binding regulatory protein
VEELTYEGYGPGGVAVLVEVMTDNRNRTVSEVRHAFNKCGGNLGTDGSVAYLFARRGQISYGPGTDENALIEEALEAGAEDIIANSDGSVDVFTAFEDFGVVRDHLDGSGFIREAADISMIPATIVSLDLGGAESVIRLVDMLEDLDDVQNVYSNADIPDDVMEQLG